MILNQQLHGITSSQVPIPDHQFAITLFLSNNLDFHSALCPDHLTAFEYCLALWLADGMRLYSMMLSIWGLKDHSLYLPVSSSTQQQSGQCSTEQTMSKCGEYALCYFTQTIPNSCQGPAFKHFLFIFLITCTI